MPRGLRSAMKLAPLRTESGADGNRFSSSSSEEASGETSGGATNTSGGSSTSCGETSTTGIFSCEDLTIGNLSLTIGRISLSVEVNGATKSLSLMSQSLSHSSLLGNGKSFSSNVCDFSGWYVNSEKSASSILSTFVLGTDSLTKSFCAIPFFISSAWTSCDVCCVILSSCFVISFKLIFISALSASSRRLLSSCLFSCSWTCSTVFPYVSILSNFSLIAAKLTFTLSISCFISLQLWHWILRSSHTEVSWWSKSRLFTSSWQPSLEQTAGAKPQSETCLSRSPSSINFLQPRSKKSQRIINSASKFLTPLDAWLSVSTVSGSLQVGHVWEFMRCMVIQALQNRCSFWGHITASLITLVQIIQWKLWLTICSKRSSS